MWINKSENKFLFTKVKLYHCAMEAKTLRAIIQDKGIKQSWIADKLGVTRQLVNAWVRGSVTVPEKHVNDLKRILQ